LIASLRPASGLNYDRQVGRDDVKLSLEARLTNRFCYPYRLRRLLQTNGFVPNGAVSLLPIECCGAEEVD
jgi:hypothetical protein